MWPSGTTHILRAFSLLWLLPLQPEDLDHGGLQTEYEGGYLLMALEHTAHPATNWHRNDLF